MKSAAAVKPNKRKYRRVHLRTQVQVLNAFGGETLGEVSNITPEGLMLSLRAPVEPGMIYQMILQLPAAINDSTVINLGAECIWSDDRETGGCYWGGFQVIDSSEAAEHSINTLIEEYGIH